MKKVYSLLGLAAIAATSFTACQKDVLPVEENAGTHTVVFTASLNETKTALGTDASTWTAEDKDNFAVYEYYTTTTDGVTNTSAKKNSSIDVAFDNEENPTVATVTATFKDLSDGQTFDGYVAVVAKNVSNSGNPIVLTEQNPTTASYDPNADILVSNKVTETEAPSNCAFSFARVVSINKMTLKNLVAGEKISSVTITADSKNFVSRYVVNTNSYIGDSYAIECKYDNETVGTDGTFDVYFTSTPAETILTLTIVTDQNLYSKTFTKSITFAANDLHTFGVNMAGCGEAVSAGTTYTLVESTSDLRNGGTYIIAAAGDNNYAMGALGSTGNNRVQVEITKNADNTIVVNNTTAVVPVQIEKDDNNKYTIANTENGYFLCHPSVSKNYLQETESFLDDENEIDTTTEWTISVANGVATITNVAANTYKIKFNASNGIFSCYTTAQTDIALYVDKTTGEENTEETSIANTLETAYTTSEATALVDAGQDLTTNVYVKGTVTSVDYSGLAEYGNVTITVTDGTKQFKYFRCLADSKSTAFTTKTIIPGDEVVAYGELTLYNGTYELKQGCYVAKLTEATVTSLTWTPETTTYDLDDTFTLDGTATAVINGVSYDVIDYVTVSEEPDMETSGEKTATVSLRGKTATAKITVGSTSTTTSIKDLVSKFTATSMSSANSFNVNLTGATVTYTNGKNAFLEDETGGVMVYLTDHGLSAGQKISGTVSGTGYLYSNLPEIITLDITEATVTTGAEIPCATVTIEELNNNYSDYISRRIKLEATTTTTGIASYSEGTISQGDNSVATYGKAADINITKGSVVDVIVYPSIYGTKKQVLVWEQPADDAFTTIGTTLTFAQESMTIKVGDEATTNVATASSGATVTYSSSNTAVVTVDATTGAVRPVAKGNATITATVAATGKYTAATASYAVTVNAAGVTSYTTTITMSAQGLTNAASLDEQSLTSDDVTFAFSKGDGSTNPAYYNTGSGARLYGSNTLTISASNATITGLTITYSGASYTGTIGASTGEYTLDSTTGTWVGESSSLVLTNTATSGHARIQKIVVTYNK